jgi:hypothetical protein
MVKISKPLTQAISVLGARPVIYQQNIRKIMPANHFMLRSFLSLACLSLTPRILDILLKCWSIPH